MSIEIRISPALSQYSDNQQSAEVSGSTVGECLDQLTERFPRLKKVLFDEKGKVQGHLEIYLNRESTYPEELARRVKDGDKLHIVPVLSGG